MHICWTKFVGINKFVKFKLAKFKLMLVIELFRKKMEYWQNPSGISFLLVIIFYKKIMKMKN